MQHPKNFYLLPSTFLLLGGLLSCSSLPQSSLNSINFSPGADVTSIRDIRPQQDSEATVYLQGKVTKQVPLIEWWVYQLQDATGTIWVLTNQTGIQQGDEVLVKGKVRYQSIPLAGKDFGEVYVEEQQQIERIPAR